MAVTVAVVAVMVTGTEDTCGGTPCLVVKMIEPKTYTFRVRALANGASASAWSEARVFDLTKGAGAGAQHCLDRQAA